MSDIVKTAVKAENWFVKFLEGIWHFIVRLAMEIWAPISDYKWHLDGWKLAGFGCVVAAYHFADAGTAMLLAGKDAASVSLVGGFFAGFTTLAPFLFGQSHNVERALISQDPTHGVRVAIMDTSSRSWFSARPLRLALLFGVLSFFSASSLWCQDFQDSETYQVKGTELNRLKSDLLTAQKSLTDSRAENAQLRQDSTDRQKALDALTGQLQTVSKSFKTSQAEALGTEIKVGAAAFVAGAALVETIHLLAK